MMESSRRSLVKTISYRLVGMIITGVIALILTGEWRSAIFIGLSDTVIKFGAYYFHERLWARIDYGRPKPPEYEI